MAIPKIEKVRRKLRELLPAWMKKEGRPPSMAEFLEEVRFRGIEISSSEYSTAKKQVMQEMGYSGEDNVANVPVKNMADANAKAREKRHKELRRAAEHILPVMKKYRLEEFTVVSEEEEARWEVQEAPPGREVEKM